MSATSNKKFPKTSGSRSDVKKTGKKRDLTSLILSGQLTVDQWRRINKKGRTALRNEAAKYNSTPTKDIKIIYLKDTNEDKFSYDSDNRVNGRLTAEQWNELYYKRQNRQTKAEGFLEKFGIPNRLPPPPDLFQCNNGIPDKFRIENECDCIKCESKKRSPMAGRQPLTPHQWKRLVSTVDGKYQELKNVHWDYAANSYRLTKEKKQSNTKIDRMSEIQKNAALKNFSEHQFSKYIEIVDKILANAKEARSRDVIYQNNPSTSSKPNRKRYGDDEQIISNYSLSKQKRTDAYDEYATINTKPNSVESQKTIFATKQLKFPAFEGSWKFLTKRKSSTRPSKTKNHGINTSVNETLDNSSSINSNFINDNSLLKYYSTAVKPPSTVKEWSQMVEVFKTVVSDNSNGLLSRDLNRSQQYNNESNFLLDRMYSKDRGSILMKPGNIKTKVKSRVSFEENKLNDALAWDYNNSGLNNSFNADILNSNSSIKNGYINYPPTKASLSNQTYNFSSAKKWFLCKSNSDALQGKKRYSFSKLNRIAKTLNINK